MSEENLKPPREWFPATPDHAIERASFALTFDGVFPGKLLSQLLARIGGKAAQSGIGQIFSIPTFQINVASGQTPIRATPTSQGQIFRKISAKGEIEKEIICSLNELRFTTISYISWQNFLSEVSYCFSEESDRILNALSIKEVRLEYWDRFSRRAAKPGPGGPLLNEKSRLVSPFFARQQESWHNHVGFFRSVMPGAASLLNANVDVNASGQATLPPGIEAEARIYTAARIQVRDESQFADWSAIEAGANQHHDLLKSLLNDIVNSELTEAINLAANPFDP